MIELNEDISLEDWAKQVDRDSSVIGGKFMSYYVIFYMRDWCADRRSLPLDEKCTIRVLGGSGIFGNAFAEGSSESARQLLEYYRGSDSHRLFLFKDIFEFASWLAEETA